MRPKRNRPKFQKILSLVTDVRFESYKSPKLRPKIFQLGAMDSSIGEEENYTENPWNLIAASESWCSGKAETGAFHWHITKFIIKLFFNTTLFSRPSKVSKIVFLQGDFSKEKKLQFSILLEKNCNFPFCWFLDSAKTAKRAINFHLSEYSQIFHFLSFGLNSSVQVSIDASLPGKYKATMDSSQSLTSISSTLPDSLL